jgi:carbonic anhydrase
MREPWVLAVRDQPGDWLENAIRENVRRTVGRLSQSEPVLLEPLRAGRLRIVGATCDLREGKVDFLA